MNSAPHAAVHFSISSHLDVDIAVLKTSKLELVSCFPESERFLLATVVSELGRNIVKYARRGSIRLTALEERRRCGVEVCSEDRGPGIADLDHALSDHVSTGGTLGLGLPGVRRMMDEFSIESEPGKGTRVTARKWTRER